MPIWDDDHTALVWMRGTYSSMHVYDLDIVGITDFGPLQGQIIGDLNNDHSFDIDDFADFLAGMYTDLTGLSPEQPYAKGDMNGDDKNDARDFILFRDAYNTTHGQGAFERALATAPEPTAFGIVLSAILVIASRRAEL